MEDTIYFYLPDFYICYDLNAELLARMQEAPEHFRDNIKIGAIYGCFPGSLWNGGRTYLGGVDKAAVEECIHRYHTNEMPIRFTWTNPIINEEKYLCDSFCNMVTALAENKNNEILVNTEILESYLRETYPGYQYISSTTKRLTDITDVNEELEKDYKLVVLDYDLNHDWDKLNQIADKGRCEILVNPTCNPKCPYRKEHYIQQGIIQRDHGGKMEEHIDTCPSMIRMHHEIKQLPCYISWDSIISEYVPAGFRHFKIEGRGKIPYKIVEDYLDYLVKEEYQEEERDNLMKAAMRNILNPTFQ